MHTHWIQDTVGFEKLYPEWAQLAEHSGASVFLHPGWFDAAWQWQPAGAQLRVLALTEHIDGQIQLLAVMPLVLVTERRRGIALRCLRFLTVPETQLCDILCLPHQAERYGQQVAAALLAARAEWDILALDYAPEHSVALAACLAQLQQAGLQVNTETYGVNWTVPLHAGWDAYYSTRSRGFKKSNNLIVNRLEQAGVVELQWKRHALDLGSAENVLRAIAPVSSGSWKASTGTTLEQQGPQRFLQRLTEHALKNNWLSLWFLTLDQRLVSYEYQLIQGGKVYALRADFVEGLDPTLSPGSYLNYKLSQALCGESGLTGYCMGPGDNNYKRKWTDEGEHLLRHVVTNTTWQARLFGMLEFKVVPLLRKLRDRCKVRPDCKEIDDRLEAGEPDQLIHRTTHAESETESETEHKLEYKLEHKPEKKVIKKVEKNMTAPISIPPLSTQTKQGWVAVIQPGQDTATLRAQLPRMAQTLSNTAVAPELKLAESAQPGLALAWSAHTVVGHAKGQWGECFIWGRPHLRARTQEAVATERDLNSIANILERKLGSEGSKALDVIRGSFVVLAVSQDRQHVFLAVDPMGVGRLSYAQQQNQVWVATRSDSIVPVLPQATLNPQALYNYVFSHAVGAPETMHKEVQQVPAGCAVHLHAGKAEVTRYWNFEFTEEAHDFPALKDEFVQLLQDIHQPYARVEQTATFLSGGTDSSTVCGMLSRMRGKMGKSTATSYSIGFQAEGYDEIGFAAAAARHFGADHRVYYVTPDDVVNTIDIVARTYDQPFGNASAVPVYWCAKHAAQDEMRLLLAGDGGDELFGGNTRYATQWLFSLFGNLPAPLRSLAKLAADHTPEGLSIISKGASYVRQASIPMPDRMHTYNLVERIGAQTIFAPELLRQIDLQQPYDEQRRIYQSAPGKSLINRMLWLDWKYTLADSDLPKVSGMCEAAGMQVAYPLLDDRMLEFSAKLAPDLKLKRTALRYFFKQALSDFLPQSTLTKSKQGFGLPFGVWLTQHAPLRERAYESLRSLDQRGLLADGFIKHILQQHQSGHAAYYGTLIWVLMMLEEWFQARQP